MISGNECRARAAECTQAASQSSDQERRVSFLELALKWLVLAEHADAMGDARRASGDVLLND